MATGIRKTLDRIGRVYGWNERPLASITDDDAAAMLHDIADRRGKKAMANQTKDVLHAMFKWAKQPGRKFVTVNPFADLPAPGGAKVTRDRFLTADRNPACSGARSTIRNRSTYQARRRDRAAPDPRDGGAARHGARHGRQRTARSARPERARSALVAARRADEGRAARSSRRCRRSRSNCCGRISRPTRQRGCSILTAMICRKRRRSIVARLGMQAWTPHDLRRTAATILDREGYSLEQIGALLAHTRKGVTAVYARWDKFGLRREMAMVIERSLRETLAEHPAAAIAA